MLSLAFIFRALASLEPVVLLARHETYVDRNMMVLFAIVAPLAFIVGAQWGTRGVAAAWLLFMPIVSLPLQERLVWRHIGVSWGNWLRAIWPAASSAAFMALAVQALIKIRPVDHAIGLLTILVLAGGIVYAAFLWTVHPTAAQALVRTFRQRPSRISATEVALGADPA